MYIPKHFEEKESKEMLKFIGSHPFGQLISMVQDRLFVSHVPFLVAHDGSMLISHVAKSNPQWENIALQEVLVTFQGPHGYISPSWYESPSVPTWNYQAVHVYGNAKLITGHEKLAKIIEDLTEKFESFIHPPWTPDYKESLLQAIVGIELTITQIEGKNKLSQNRSRQDRDQVVNALESSGSGLLAKAMKKN